MNCSQLNHLNLLNILSLCVFSGKDTWHLFNVSDEKNLKTTSVNVDATLLLYILVAVENLKDFSYFASRVGGADCLLSSGDPTGF